MNVDERRSSAKIIQWAVPAVILIAFLIFTLVDYSKAMKTSTESRALDKISSKAVYVAGYEEGMLNTLIKATEGIANNMVGSENLFDEANVSILSNVAKELELENAYIVNTEGTAIDMDGVIHSEENDNALNFSGILVSEPAQDVYSKKKGLTVARFSAPIRTEKDWWGSVIVEFKPNQLDDMVDSSFYSYSIVFSNGIVAETTGEDNGLYKVGDDINKVLDSVTFIEGTKYGYKQNIEAGRSGYISIASPSGEKQYLSYRPIGDFGAYVLVSVMDYQIKRSVASDNKVTTNLILKIVIAIAVFVALLLTIYIINRVAFARQNKELQDKAETDLLTDLLNKVSTENKIEEYLANEGKDKVSMMCVLDIDNFKKINDTMGHAFGDEVIASLGKGIQSEFRVSDILGRIGGDEFVIFLKDVKDDAVIQREAGRITGFFKDFTVGSYTKYSPTASIGVAIYPRDAHDYKSLYKAADTALYKAKKRGKNQLAFYKEDSSDEDEGTSSPQNL